MLFTHCQRSSIIICRLFRVLTDIKGWHVCEQSVKTVNAKYGIDDVMLLTERVEE